MSCLFAAATTVIFGNERNLCAFNRCPKASLFKSRYVDKNVLAAAFRGDEAEATVVIEKFDGAVLAHGEAFPKFVQAAVPGEPCR